MAAPPYLGAPVLVVVDGHVCPALVSRAIDKERCDAVVFCPVGPRGRTGAIMPTECANLRFDDKGGAWSWRWPKGA